MNRISLQLTSAEVDAIQTALATLTSSVPASPGLSKDDRMGLPKMGDKSRAFVRKALDLARLDASFLPRTFDVEEMEKDLNLFETLYPFLMAVTQLQERLEDLCLLSGSESYSAALVVYNNAKINGQGQDLDALVDSLGRRFIRKSVGAAKVASTPAQS
jgi:hypothetical protein